MKFSSSCVVVAAIMMASGYQHQAQADDTVTGNTGRRRRGETSVRGQGRQEESQRRLSPLTPGTCVQEKFVCEWKSEFDIQKNKYAICVEDGNGKFESKCVDAKSATSGRSGSDMITCGCCERDTPGGKGDFNRCSSIVSPTKPGPCNEEKLKCQNGSGKGKGSTGGASYCARIALGKGLTPTFGISDQCGDP